ncbi:MAG: hypothetical protein ACRDTG_08860 [Pseudonocardiaceae bacterium]
MRSPAPEPTATPPSPRRRRRLPWLIGLGGVLVGGLAGGLLVAGGFGHDRPAPDLGFVAEAELITSAFPGEGDGDRPGGHHGPFGPGPWRLGPDEQVVVGTVAGSGANDLTVAQDGGSQTSIPTDEDTRVRGAGNHELSDLNAGERVVVRLGPDGTAAAVSVVQARVLGTVTTLDGDRATVLRPDGLAVQIDLTGVQERPEVGTVVAVRGSAESGGGVLRAEEVTTS